MDHCRDHGGGKPRHDAPASLPQKYDLSPGDKIFLQETADGILVTAHDPLFAEAMEISRRIGKKYRNALRELSKR